MKKNQEVKMENKLRRAGMMGAIIPIAVVSGIALANGINYVANLFKSKQEIANRLASQNKLEQVVEVEKADAPVQGVEESLEPVYDVEEAYKKENMKDNSLLAYATYTANFEGRRAEVYDPNPKDKKYEPTIGVGHYLNRGDSRETFARVLPEVDYDDVYTGKKILTNEQIDRLFAEDIKEHVEKARRLFPQFDTYPKYLRQALVDGCYRGDLSGSPKTRKLINQGRFEEAANLYIQRKDYKNAEKNKMRGIIPRMNMNRDSMLKYARERIS